MFHNSETPFGSNSISRSTAADIYGFFSFFFFFYCSHLTTLLHDALIIVVLKDPGKQDAEMRFLLSQSQRSFEACKCDQFHIGSLLREDGNQKRMRFVG